MLTSHASLTRPLVALAAVVLWAQPFGLSLASGVLIAPGRLSEDTTWTGTVLVGQPLAIEEGVTLRLEPGTELRFAASARLTVKGTLEAVGTETQSIVFTSDSRSPEPGNWAGIDVEGARARADLRRCAVRYAQGLSVGGAHATLRESRFEYGVSGVTARKGSTLQVRGSTLSSLSSTGIVFERGAKGEAEENTLERCAAAGVVSEGDTRTLVRANTISDCGRGIVAEQNDGEIQSNKVEHCDVGILVISSRAACKVTANRVSGCRLGIVCTQFSSPLVEDNEISTCQEGLLCYQSSHPQIRNCTLRNNKKAISCVQLSCPVITANDIGDNDIGIYLHFSSYAVVHGNNLFGNKRHLELGTMSSDWERRANASPLRGSRARNATFADKARPPGSAGKPARAPEAVNDAPAPTSVDATGNWWGEETTDEMNRKGPDANIERIFDFFDTPRQTLEGREESYEKDRVVYLNWARLRLAGTGKRCTAP